MHEPTNNNTNKDFDAEVIFTALSEKGLDETLSAAYEAIDEGDRFVACRDDEKCERCPLVSKLTKLIRERGMAKFALDLAAACNFHGYAEAAGVRRKAVLQ